MASKKPKGLTITRKNGKYIFKWKKGETYADGERLIWGYVQVTTSGNKSTKTRWESGTVKLSGSKTDYTVNVPVTYTDIAYVYFKVRGKANGEAWSDWENETFKLDPPKDPTASASWDSATPNKTSFSFTAQDEDHQPYNHIEWQTILVKNCPSDYKAASLWKGATKHTKTGTSGTVYNTAESALTGSWARIVRVRSIGQGGASDWRYAYHVYASPNAPYNVVVDADYDVTNQATDLTVKWDAMAPAMQRPIDTTKVQYCIGVPTAGFGLPTGASWTDVATPVNTALNVWETRLAGEVGLDECLFIRVVTVHDTHEVGSTFVCAYKRELTAPTLGTITPTKSTHTIAVAVTNGSQNPDSKTAVTYRDPATGKVGIVGVIAHGSSSMNVLVPTWEDSAGTIGAFAFVGDSSQQKSNPYYVYSVNSVVKSQDVWATSTRTAPTITAVQKDEETVNVAWNWSWADATNAELSWADRPDAWESTSQPSTYVVNNNQQASWNVTGLDEGKIYYFRVRLFYGENDENIYSDYSNTAVVDMTQPPEKPVLELSDTIVPVDGTVTASWQNYEKQTYAELIETASGVDSVIAEVGSGSSVEFSPADFGWSDGTAHVLSVRVYLDGIGSLKSDTVTVNVAEALSCVIAQDSLVYEETPLNPETYTGNPAQFDGGTEETLREIISASVALAPHQAGTPFPSVQVALNVNRYGVKWDMVNAQMTRTLDAEGVTTNLTNFRHWGSVNASYDNPFDSIYPWSDRKLCNIDMDAYRSLQSGQSIKDCVTYWEGDAGFDYNDRYGVWVYTPEFWARSYIENGYRYFEIATNALTDYLYYEESICGRYLGCDVTLTIDGTSKHCNLPTVGMPMANVSMANMHTYAKNWGATINDIYSIDRVSTLYLVEMANMNLQNSIGGGVSSLYVQTLHPSSASTGNTVTFSGLTSAQLSHIIPNAIVDLGTSDGGMQIKRTYITAVSTSGTTTTVTLAESVTVDTSTFFSVHGLINIADSEIGSKSGFIGTNTKANAYYRGQTFYANKYQYILGAYRQQNTGEIWIANKGESDNYDALDTSVHIDTGNALTQASGYIQTLGMTDELSFAPFCTGVGGNATNPVGDYCYVPGLSTVNTCLLLGGASISGAACGWYGIWDSTAGASNWFFGSSPSLITP